MTSARHRGRRLAAWLGILLGLATIVISTAGTASMPPQPPSAVDTIILRDGNRKIRLLVYRDEIGCVLQQPKDRKRLGETEQFKQLKVKLTLEPQKSGVRNIAIYKASRQLKQVGRQQIALDLNKRYPFILGAGPVVRYAAGGKPFVLINHLRVEFQPGLSLKAVQKITKTLNTEIVSRHHKKRHVFFVRVVKYAEISLLDVIRRYQKHPKVRYLGVDLLLPRTTLREQPARPVLIKQNCKQWHHANDGTIAMTCADADIDSVPAWKITEGNPDVVIAVIDDGFLWEHPDIKPNLWTNPREVPGDGKDNDGNGKVDDVHGWDFVGSGDPDMSGSNHGSFVASCAAGRDHSGHGYFGACPTAKPMLLRAIGLQQIAAAFEYAADHGASIINCSHSIPQLKEILDAVRHAIQQGRCRRGCILTYAMDPGESATTDECASDQSLAGHHHILAVGWCDPHDRKHENPKRLRPFGRCMSLLAPGFGIVCPDHPTSQFDKDCPKGYSRQTGTSLSAPLTAGVAGLVLSACPELTWQQVKHLLQDTCDKIDPNLAHYAAGNGRSSADHGRCTHGFGRLNAFEAVRTVAPATKQHGRGGFDLLIRDNELDWGNTEQASSVLFKPSKRDFIPYWESVDIKLDCEPFQPVAKNSRDFDQRLLHENPSPNKMCRVYVRVRNRGPFTALKVKVHLCATALATLLPKFPTPFWQGRKVANDKANGWQYVQYKCLAELPYSGASVAGTSRDQAGIVCFDWHVPPNAASGFSLLAFADCDQDPLAATGGDLPAIVPFNNNIALRSVFVANTHNTHKAECPFQLRGPAGTPSVLKFRHPDWKLTGLPDVNTNSVTVAGGTNQKVTLKVETPRRETTGRVRMIQKKEHNGKWIPIGGLTLQLVSHR